MAQKRKLSDEQIIRVVKQLKAGRTAAEMAREIGVITFTRSTRGRQSSAEWSRARWSSFGTWKTKTAG